ncbi:hypothetical protein FRB99_007323 [Tulasnella sp. 403]|nr:hypothetical protein FRB99_007323 [Tulasnella sp. 403]
MAHPYANASLHHHHHRTQPSTPSSSVSQLSIVSSFSQSAHSFGARSALDGSAVVPAGSNTVPIPPTENPVKLDPSTSTTGPERRRRRSLRAPSKASSRKKSVESSATVSSKADEKEPHVPTRHYQFKAFESFDNSTPSVAFAGGVPSGADYTFGPPPSATCPVPGLQDSGPSSAAHAKKSKVLLTVGKRVVKEVLGGGGNNAQPPEAKVVYYGRGGAGGAGVRATKSFSSSAPSSSPDAQALHSQSGSAVPKHSTESHRSSSYYTGSSQYTPSILSSPYAESIASSPYATSVDDGSQYGPSSYSAPRASSSLRPSSHPSPSHRSVSPVGFSESRRASVVSSFPGTHATSDYEDFGEDVAQYAQPYNNWPQGYQEGSSGYHTPSLVEDAMSRADVSEESGYQQYGGENFAMQEVQGQRTDLLDVPSHSLRHIASQHSVSTFREQSIVPRVDHTTAYPVSSINPTDNASSYLQPMADPMGNNSDPNIGPVSSEQAQSALAALLGYKGSSTNVDFSTVRGVASPPADSPPSQDEFASPSLNGVNRPLPQEPPQPTRPPLPNSTIGGLVPRQTPIQSQPPHLPTSSAPPQGPWAQPTIAAGRTSALTRSLPDPLAVAVGQLSLIQNPLHLGWPAPPSPQQYNSPPRQQLPYHQLPNNSALPQFSAGQLLNFPVTAPAASSSLGMGTSSYSTQSSVPSALSGAVPLLPSEKITYEQALAEQQMLARRLAQLEGLQQQQQQRQQQFHQHVDANLPSANDFNGSQFR